MKEITEKTCPFCTHPFDGEGTYCSSVCTDNDLPFGTNSSRYRLKRSLGEIIKQLEELTGIVLVDTNLELPINDWIEMGYAGKALEPVEDEPVESGEPLLVPEGSTVIINSKTTGEPREFFFEHGYWYGYGVNKQRIRETETMQEILTTKFFNQNGK
jgi:hypothetical protein